jgi:tRNA pseudouridine55 synthase
MPTYDFRSGEVLLIRKPLQWTSFQVVNKMKYIIKHHPSLLQDGKRIQPKIGHAGTLDPLATGLLIICTGKQTKNIEQFQALEKEYTGTFLMGATTPCFDLEKEIDARYPIEHLTEELICRMAQQFTGVQQQTPPLFSAIKIGGKRAYELARAGKEAEIRSKEIVIHEFKITRIALPEVDFKVVCSKGTYIRSLARDFGQALGTGAHLTALCRTRIGNYKLEDAMSLEEFEKEVRVENNAAV